MDIEDMASEQEEFARATALNTKKPEGPKCNGSCHWCAAELPEPRRWCDTDCRTYWERDKTRSN